MVWKRPTFRMVAAGLVVFVIGVVVGAAALAAVAARASRAYLRTSQITFLLAEERQASEAWRAGDFEAATGHAFCAVEVEHGRPASQAFRHESQAWDLFGLFFLQKVVVEPNEPIRMRALPKSEAVSRAKLAVAWERLGHADAANREYAKVIALTGNKNVAMWRALGLNTVDVWSTAQENQMGSPSAVPPNGGDVQQGSR